MATLPLGVGGDHPPGDVNYGGEDTGPERYIEHAFKCHCGSLLTHAHNDVTCELICLLQKDSYLGTCRSGVHSEPKINTGRQHDLPELPVPKAKANTAAFAIDPSEVEPPE